MLENKEQAKEIKEKVECSINNINDNLNKRDKRN